MKILRAITRRISCNQAQCPPTNSGLCRNLVTDGPKKFQFKLIAVIACQNMLSSAELDQYVHERKKNKPLVTAIIYKNHIHLQHKKTGKAKNKMIISSPLENIIGSFKIDSEPRAVGFTILNPGSPQSCYISIILISKKRSLFKKKKIEETFADIVVNKIKSTHKYILNTKDCVRVTPSVSSVCINNYTRPQYDDEVGTTTVVHYSSESLSMQGRNTTCGRDSNNPLTWPMDIFASERCQLQSNQNILQSSPVKAVCPSESKSTHLQSGSLEKQCDNETTTWQSSRDASVYQQREKHLSDLSAALNSSFANSNYMPLSNSHLWLQHSDEVFNQESGLLQYMDMLVPLKSKEAAACSRMNIFEYIPLHVQDPSLDAVSACEDYKMSSPQLKDLNDSSIPEHVRKGVSYDESDLIYFNPEFETTNEDHSDNVWFSGDVDTALVVGYTWNNGLQHFPTVPNANFIHRMEKLFNAYLNPKIYHERNLGITNNPEKLARFLSSTDYPGIEKLRIFSYRDPKLSHCWFFPPCCARDPDLNLILD